MKFVNEAHFNVMINASRKANRLTIRDFMEIENLQQSRSGTIGFASKSEDRICKILCDELSKARENYNILDHKLNVLVEGREGLAADHRFIIYPLDGFNNFTHGIPLFSTIIALQKRNLNQEFESLAILIDCPVLKEVYACEKGGGAWRETYAESITKSGRLRVSSRKEISDLLIASAYEINNDNFKIRYLNCLGLELAYFASGKFDYLITKDKIIAEIFKIIALEAGGNMLTKRDYFIFHNNQNYQQVIEWV